MELIIIITMLCMCVSVLLIPCASQQIQVQSSKELGHDHQLISIHTLPRKLKLNEAAAVKGFGDEDLASYNKQKETLSGKPHHKEEHMMHARRGTWQEWVESTDKSQFFTMDYSHVRRRRPIHNKSLPVGP